MTKEKYTEKTTQINKENTTENTSKAKQEEPQDWLRTMKEMTPMLAEKAVHLPGIG